MLGGKRGQGLAGNGTADACERDRRSDRLANDQLLDVSLRELVAIMAADPARAFIHQREYGKLDDRRSVDQAVEDAELVAVHDVLGVVQDDGLGALAGASLEGDQRVVEMVEAIGLGRRPVRFDAHVFHPVVRHAGNRRSGRRVVPVVPDENAIVGIVETLQRRPQHLRDDRRFIPGGDEDGDEAGVLVEDVIAGECTAVAFVDSVPAPEAADKVDDIHSEVVEPEQQEADPGEQGELRGYAREEFRGRHDGKRCSGR